MPQGTPQRPTMGRRTVQRDVPQTSTMFAARNAAAVNDLANDMRRRRSANRNEAVKVHGCKKRGTLYV
jgi:hypothetical protein